MKSKVLNKMQEIDSKKPLTNKEQLDLVGKRYCLDVLREELEAAIEEEREDMVYIYNLIDKIKEEVRELEERI